jgi:hypothetical protein
MAEKALVKFKIAAIEAFFSFLLNFQSLSKLYY